MTQLEDPARQILTRLEDALDDGLDTTLLRIAREAGGAIMEIYEDPEADFDIDRKADDSPLTKADLASNDVIQEGLTSLPVDLPVLSEEAEQAKADEREGWDAFWLVDPLDGTKEFIKQNGEFTVNIALIVEDRPVAGVVHAPDLAKTYWGRLDEGALLLEPQGKPVVLETVAPDRDQPLGVVVSRSHLNDATQAFVDELSQAGWTVDLVPSGSSLKFCRIAEGTAHLYPRLAPTMEWDTGAAQAVLEAAGGVVVQASGEEAGRPLRYNKQELLNPHFIAASNQDLIPEA